MVTHRELTTRISTKGQIILPKTIRNKRDWPAGTRLLVEDTPDGVILRQASPFPATQPEDVFGILHREGPARTIDEMDAAIMEEARRRHDRDRYYRDRY